MRTERIDGWPITREARDGLVDEIARLRAHVSAMSLAGLEEGILGLPISIALGRLALLREVLEHGRLVDGSPCAAIGRRTTLRDVDGVPITFQIVLPGQSDVDGGRIPADSPVGRAVLGAQPGDVVEISAPAGRWTATVVAVA
jgi:hypothetical protein